MSINDRYSRDASSKRRTGQTTIVGAQGWSPFHNSYEYQGNTYVQVAGYYNTEDADPSTKPPYEGWFIGANGLVPNVEDATPINQVSGIIINDYIIGVPVEDPGIVPWTVVDDQLPAHIWLWNGSTWEDLGPITVDVSGLAQKAEGTLNELLIDDGSGNPIDSGKKIDATGPLTGSATLVPTESVVKSYTDAHINNTNNPHQVGLSQLSDYTAGVEINMDGNYIQNLAEPDSPSDAATKNYVDTEIAGISLSGNYIKTGAFAQPEQTVNHLAASTIQETITANYVNLSVEDYAGVLQGILPTPTVDYLDTEVTFNIYDTIGTFELYYDGTPDVLIDTHKGNYVVTYKCVLSGIGTYAWRKSADVNSLYTQLKQDGSYEGTVTINSTTSTTFTIPYQYDVVNTVIPTDGSHILTYNIKNSALSAIGRKLYLVIPTQLNSDTLVIRLLSRAGSEYKSITENFGGCIYEFELIYNPTGTPDPTTIIYKKYSYASIVDEDDMVSNSNTAVPTQQSVKAFVDTELNTLSTTTLNSGSVTISSLDFDDYIQIGRTTTLQLEFSLSSGGTNPSFITNINAGDVVGQRLTARLQSTGGLVPVDITAGLPLTFTVEGTVSGTDRINVWGTVIDRT